MSDEDSKPIEELVNKAVQVLSEHCDSVKIFVTWQATDGKPRTRSYHYGAGNLYAVQGLVTDWLEEERVKTQEYTRRRIRQEEEEGN